MAMLKKRRRPSRQIIGKTAAESIIERKLGGDKCDFQDVKIATILMILKKDVLGRTLMIFNQNPGILCLPAGLLMPDNNRLFSNTFGKMKKTHIVTNIVREKESAHQKSIP